MSTTTTSSSPRVKPYGVTMNGSIGNGVAKQLPLNTVATSECGIPNCQELFLSMLNNESRTSANGSKNTSHSSISPSLQSELSSTLSRMIRKNARRKANENFKRKHPTSNNGDVIDLIEDSSTSAIDNGVEPPQKRARLEEDAKEELVDDDAFINNFYREELGMVNSDLDKMVHERSKQADPLQKEVKENDNNQGLEQQKELLLRWFSERLGDLETSIQSIFKQKDRELQAKNNELQAKCNLLKAKNTELQATAAALKAQSLELSHQKKYTQNLEQKNNEMTQKLQQFDISDDDKARVDVAQGRYLPVRSRIRKLLLKRVPKEDTDYAECAALLHEESNLYCNFVTAIADEILILKCQHFNERSSDRYTIQDLEARLEAAKQEAIQFTKSDGLPQYPANNPANVSTSHQQQQAARIAELTDLLSKSRQANQELRARGTDLGSRNDTVNNMYDNKLNSVIELEQRLKQVTSARAEALAQVKRLESQNKILTLTNTNQQMALQQAEQANSFHNMRFSQANAQLQQVVNTNSQSLHWANQMESKCDKTIQETKQRHEKEMRSAIHNHMGQMKGNALRMEQMTNTIKQLSARNRLYEERIEERTLTINQLSASRKTNAYTYNSSDTDDDGNRWNLNEAK
ncbi:expressed unknown protein [Seminavis robusta]|uniref:Uncharacterized protein n=1 Tax=Seminavis robusta TaxID=568900 RepID=A0A9N8HJJ0_9STRA|nr:expressed unknown protein [Seminavis robusta]|eukprot:Sro555_g165650.1 n/a (635) ;mRNA; f:13465-15369